MNFRQSPYLRNQRKFPDEIKELTLQLDDSYIDIALKVNSRIIGVFSTNYMTQTGESWYLDGEPNKQQTLRRLYEFDDSNLTIAHGINFASITNFTRIYGTFYDTFSSTWNTLPYIDVADVTKQINVTINSTDIIITKGAASTAVIANGILVVEWLSQK